jgi:hypothetical protein
MRGELPVDRLRKDGTWFRMMRDIADRGDARGGPEDRDAHPVRALGEERIEIGRSAPMARGRSE